jgi:ABC-type dipeptide/oligopeptide/nickel transport system permease subunit
MTTATSASSHTIDVIIDRPPRSPTQDAIRALFRTKSAIAGMVILVILTLVAIFAPVSRPIRPTKC